MQNTSCFETIRIENKIAHNIFYHQKRFNRTRKELYNSADLIDLQSLITPPSNALYKCRIVYDEKIRKIEYLPYTKKIPRTFTLIEANIEYSYKFSDRKTIEKLKKKSTQEDIIIVKNGLLTDTSISNMAFFDSETWFTPKLPLLEGTMRAKLLDEGFLKEETIKVNDLARFTNFALMNAMIGFEVIKTAKIYKGDQCLKIF